MPDLVEVLVLTRNVGRHVAIFTLAHFEGLHEFLSKLGEFWLVIAEYLGYDRAEFNDPDVGADRGFLLGRFVGEWGLPDCGAKNLIILHKLSNVAKIVIKQELPRKERGKERGTLLQYMYVVGRGLSYLKILGQKTV